MITPDTAIEYLARYSQITQNSRARYAVAIWFPAYRWTPHGCGV